MSYSLSDGAQLLGQFSSNQGYSSLIHYLSTSQQGKDGKYPALHNLVSLGYSKQVPQCIEELKDVAASAESQVASTAAGMIELMEGEKLVVVTDGTASPPSRGMDGKSSHLAGLRKYSSDEPRDDKGQWTSGPAASTVEGQGEPSVWKERAKKLGVDMLKMAAILAITVGLSLAASLAIKSPELAASGARAFRNWKYRRGMMRNPAPPGSSLLNSSTAIFNHPDITLGRISSHNLVYPEQGNRVNAMMNSLAANHAGFVDILAAHPIPNIIFAKSWAGKPGLSEPTTEGFYMVGGSYAGHLVMNPESAFVDQKTLKSVLKPGKFIPGKAKGVAEYSKNEEGLREKIFVHESGHHIFEEAMKPGFILGDKKPNPYGTEGSLWERVAAKTATNTHADLKAAYRQALSKPDGGISKYARVSEHEYFAESFVAYQYHPEELRSHDPAAYAVIDKVMKNYVGRKVTA